MTLKRLGVVDGFKGLHMYDSRVYINGTEDIALVCKYKVKVLKLLNIDYSFSFVQCAKTKAWGAKSLVDERMHEKEENAVDGKEVKLEGDDDEYKKFVEYASKAQPVDGYVDVIVHCNEYEENGVKKTKMQVYANGAWVDISSNNLKRIMKNRGLEGQNIRLISCGTGSNKIAQSVADTLNVDVLAPSNTVWAYPDGYMTVGSTAQDKSGTWKVVKPNNKGYK